MFLKNNMKPTTQNKTKTKIKTPNIKKGEIRNPKGRGADLFKVEMSFNEVINKLIPSAKK
jgi:hypothetical protein